MRTLKLVIEYDGTNYHGWQVQPNGLTIQQVIEQKIEIMTRQRVRLTASGRTDAGVHALGQVASLRIASAIPAEALRRGLNSLLPADIVIRSVEEAAAGFHAQHQAKRKTYRYQILNRTIPSAFHYRSSWHIPAALDLGAMQAAARALVGRHDFSSFQGANADTTDPVREVLDCAWLREETFLVFRIEADGFLHYMVRNIVGTLADVGRGRIGAERFGQILQARDRRQAGMTAPPRGLFLVEVKY